VRGPRLLGGVIWASSIYKNGTKFSDSIAPPSNTQPKEFVSENGQLDVTLNVDLVYSLAGIPWSTTGFRTAPGFNDGAIGPTLRVKPGDNVTVTLNNNLDPSPELDRELNAYVMDPANKDSNDANVTVIYNRLSEIGNIVSIRRDFRDGSVF
jgi:FtsP/CotA-like multicopper oxidase with cupredoxin domain